MTLTAAIVCGAGVSSTFLARALRERVAEHGLEWAIEPLAEDQLTDHAERFAVVFVGHHLADRLDQIRLAVAPHGVPVCALDSDAHTDAARQALAVLLDRDPRTSRS